MYNTQCKLTFKEDNQYQVRMEYEPRLQKLVRIDRLNRKDSTRSVSKYAYNSEGDLLRAEDQDGWVELSYNPQRKISEMKYEEGTLLFEYNSIGKPVVIEIKGGGKLLVTYDSKGEILSAKSADGNVQTGQQITRAFTALLNRIKPTGVSLD
jgi:YD repeat-containing protein